jgi:hypothetical protein
MAKRPRPAPLPLPWFEPWWSALGRRIAASAGAAAGLLALLAQASPSTAAARGALACFSVLGLFRLGGLALRSRWAAPSADRNPGAEPPQAR